MSAPFGPLEAFISYAHQDESYLKALHAHLSILRRNGYIVTWYDRQIIAGTDWTETIDTHLETSSLILLLVSADFLASDYCYEREMRRALELHDAGSARVIPIVVRSCDWQHAPFRRLQALPEGGIPITEWADQDKALLDVVQGIRRVLEDRQQGSVTSPRTLLPSVWNIPHPRNPVFIGREKILADLADTLKTGQATALSQPQAISGLGGIGKTQIAVEYAYQHCHDYQAVLWTLADTRDSLVSGYATFAELLKLPEKDEQDQTKVVSAVKRWFTTNTQWLLILDNADDLAVVREFLPTTFGGHILLTTIAQAMGGLAHRIEVGTMSQDTGALFLLRRTGLIAQHALLQDALDVDVTTAREISAELGGLPLALDQAGAYIEKIACGLTAYQRFYQGYRKDLLKERGGLVDDHPKPVATTWALSFVKIEQKNPAAADLLRFCAFLHPDAISEEMIIVGTEYFGPVLQPLASDALLLNNALGMLRDYSLINRNEKAKTLSIHRLVRAVLQDTMGRATRQDWAQRVVLAVNAARPNVQDVKQRDACELWLPHALECLTWIEQEDIIHPDAAVLLHSAGCYLNDHARYAEAEPLYLRALRIYEQNLGAEHPDVASPLNGLANLYAEQGKYAQAEPLYQRALQIREQSPGPEHLDVASPLNGLANLYAEQGKDTQAEPLYQRALRIWEQSLGPEHPDMASPLNGLANLYAKQGKDTQAEPLYQRALRIWEQSLGPEHPDMASPLNNLAVIYRKQGKYEQAEPLYQRALQIMEQNLGPEHPDVATSLNNLADLYREQGKHKQAKPLYLRALQTKKRQLGSEYHDTKKYLYQRRFSRRTVLKRAVKAGLGAGLVITGGASPKPVTVNLFQTMHPTTETYWKQKLLPSFEKQHPNINLVISRIGDIVGLTEILNMLKEGKVPDMIWMDSKDTGAYVEGNLLSSDVDGWLNSHADLKQNILPRLAQISSYQGKIWSLPWMTNNTAMLINLEAFKAAGVPVPSQDPTQTWTWDQFAEACKLISQKTNMKGFLIHNGNYVWDVWVFHAWLATNGGTFLSDTGDPHFNSSAGLETMTFLQNLVKDNYTLPCRLDDLGLWYSGKVAIAVNGSWKLPELVESTHFEFTVVPYPIKTQPATNIGGDQLFIFNINNDSQKVASSFNYAQYMLSDDFQVAFSIQSGNLPVTKSAIANTRYQAHLKQYPFLNGWINAVPYGVVRSCLPHSAKAQEIFGQKAWDPIILQGANVRQSLEDAARAVSALTQPRPY